PGQNVYGCAFIHLGPTDAAKLAELLEDPGHGRAAVDLGDLRRLRNAAGDGDGGSGSWRSRLFGS
ncbi:MAG TPA: hypothetical protein VMU66_01910, partial [Gaiellales bacterium]|nr:hypothetical protein [Gaiellales bacterium]